MSAVITPTPGRIVWYWPAFIDGIPSMQGQPLAAIVATVHDDRRVNLSVIDSYGNHHARTNVYLNQPDEERPIPGSFNFAEWMPYQKGQAAKTEQAQTALADALKPGNFVAQSTATDPIAMFAETDGTSASETGLAHNPNEGAEQGPEEAPVSNITTESQL